MGREADHYSADEAARLLGLSPARVRQMLRAGELAGERGPELFEGVLGPWRVSAGAVHAYNERRGQAAADDAETIVDSEPEDWAPVPTSEPSEPADAPSETSERLSEGIGELRRRAMEFLEELERLEVRVEAAEVEQLATREALGREEARSARLQAELEAEKARSRGQQGGSSWRRLFRG